MFKGTQFHFRITRELRNRNKEQVDLKIEIPAGTRSGTRILCEKAGHELKDGTIQDVVFLVEETPHGRFARVKDDLFLDISVPWDNSLLEQPGEVCIKGIDGQELSFKLPYPIYEKATEGQVIIKGAGMPTSDDRKKSGRRGDLIVRCVYHLLTLDRIIDRSLVDGWLSFRARQNGRNSRTLPSGSKSRLCMNAHL
ncbi:hypothetical protein CONPUDRAFT_49882 [Coniophora puteana RWD-64-598 SS2]|uniref:Chaperone DnaJ C-terminal domain-containing protein n=1 Tax=Coniophora puteana (strain RWD-64-598) TaxID=741705 RepID=A0A5M3N072_CONPW|nr:uncharacterized protein CONPUDRAFT_49882 [Coniophora puteana RWD-64-598 SS2]EIW84305.1 hypothetical protein CONPUDRAFT_49882 [Coniophora puteana RWD-64-598 SS2]